MWKRVREALCLIVLLMTAAPAAAQQMANTTLAALAAGGNIQVLGGIGWALAREIGDPATFDPASQMSPSLYSVYDEGSGQAVWVPKDVANLLLTLCKSCDDEGFVAVGIPRIYRSGGQEPTFLARDGFDAGSWIVDPLAGVSVIVPKDIEGFIKEICPDCAAGDPPPGSPTPVYPKPPDCKKYPTDPACKQGFIGNLNLSTPYDKAWLASIGYPAAVFWSADAGNQSSLLFGLDNAVMFPAKSDGADPSMPYEIPDLCIVSGCRNAVPADLATANVEILVGN